MGILEALMSNSASTSTSGDSTAWSDWRPIRQIPLVGWDNEWLVKNGRNNSLKLLSSYKNCFSHLSNIKNGRNQLLYDFCKNNLLNRKTMWERQGDSRQTHKRNGFVETVSKDMSWFALFTWPSVSGIQTTTKPPVSASSSGSSCQNKF